VYVRTGVRLRVKDQLFKFSSSKVQILVLYYVSPAEFFGVLFRQGWSFVK